MLASCTNTAHSPHGRAAAATCLARGTRTGPNTRPISPAGSAVRKGLWAAAVARFRASHVGHADGEAVGRAAAVRVEVRRLELGQPRPHLGDDRLALRVVDRVVLRWILEDVEKTRAARAGLLLRALAVAGLAGGDVGEAAVAVASLRRGAGAARRARAVRIDLACPAQTRQSAFSSTT